MSDDPRPHHRPMLPGAAHFEAITDDADPAARTEAADRCASLLVRGAHDTDDAAVVARVVHLAETEGLDTLADLWSGSPADSLAGCLWRVFPLRSRAFRAPAAARGRCGGLAVGAVPSAFLGVRRPGRGRPRVRRGSTPHPRP